MDNTSSVKSFLKILKEKSRQTKRKRKDEQLHASREEEDPQDWNRSTFKLAKSSFTISKARELAPHTYILAPMVGASELPFRLLCRKYGAQLSYTPMLNARSFATDPDYRNKHFPVGVEADHPVSVHVSANTPEDFCQAGLMAQQCGADAIDLNLGCPQRTAWAGHFGSYLMDDPDLIVRMIKETVARVVIPVTVKIRLLPTLDETTDFCRRLYDAGVSLVAIHARQRASWERTSKSARDGPADLDQVRAIQSKIPQLRIIANGNTIAWDDVEKNLNLTQASGIMSAEGILDNPTLFLPRHGSDRESMVKVWTLDTSVVKKRRKYNDKLAEISTIEVKDPAMWTPQETDKVARKQHFTKKLSKLHSHMRETKMSLGRLMNLANDRLQVCLEYLDLAEAYPTTMRTIVFHCRRMLKDYLTQYQLLESCVSSKSINDIRKVVHKIRKYIKHPSSFQFDSAKAKEEEKALERRKFAEGRRKAYEARMMRKAKREGKSLAHYLEIGATLPTSDSLERLKLLPRTESLQIWKENHSQHCLAYHLASCERGRACAFLHVDIDSKNTFDETAEMAG